MIGEITCHPHYFKINFIIQSTIKIDKEYLTSPIT